MHHEPSWLNGGQGRAGACCASLLPPCDCELRILTCCEALPFIDASHLSRILLQVNTGGAGMRSMGGGDTSPLGGTGLADGVPDHSPFGAYFVPPSQRLDLGFSPSRTLSGRPTMMMPASPRRFHLDTVTRSGGGAFLHATASEAQSCHDQPYVGVSVSAEVATGHPGRLLRGPLSIPSMVGSGVVGSPTAGQPSTPMGAAPTSLTRINERRDE